MAHIWSYTCIQPSIVSYAFTFTETQYHMKWNAIEESRFNLVYEEIEGKALIKGNTHMVVYPHQRDYNIIYELTQCAAYRSVNRDTS